MNQPAKILVSVATYNEIENLPRLVEQIEVHLPTADILVVDDASPDGTGQWCDKRANSDPRLTCLHRSGKLGLGTATIAAMQHAIAGNYRWLVNLDADFSHPPDRLPALVEVAEEQGSVDVVIGSRYVPGGGIEGWPFSRRWMSNTVNWYSRWFLGLPVRDCSGAYRCYRVARLRELDFDRVRAKGYAFQEEILWHLKRLGCTFAEVPITFVDRRAGTTKVSSREALRSSLHLLWLGLRNLWPR